MIVLWIHCFLFFFFFEDVFDFDLWDCLSLGCLSQLRVWARANAHCVIITDYVTERELFVSLSAGLASLQAVCTYFETEAMIMKHRLYAFESIPWSPQQVFM